MATSHLDTLRRPTGSHAGTAMISHHRRAVALCFWFAFFQPTAWSQSATKSSNAQELRVVNTTLHVRCLSAVDDESSVQSSVPMSPDQKNPYLEACLKFARPLTNNQGLWGSGPFTSARLEIDDQTIKKSSSVSRSSLSKPPVKRWILSVKPTEDGILFEIFFRPDASNEVSLSKVFIDELTDPMNIFSDSSLSHMIAARLTLDLPMRSVVRTSSLMEKGQEKGQIKAPKKSALGMAGPNESSAFELSYSNGIWIPDMVAVLNLTSKGKGEQIWSVTEQIKQTKQRFVFLQQTEDRSKWIKAIDTKLPSRVERLQRKIFERERSAYAGIRFGYPVFGGEGVLAQSPMIGVVGEFRKGWLRGFRLNYDLTLKSELLTEDGSKSFEGSRLQLGYALGFKLPLPVFNWVDLTPKVGITNMEYLVTKIIDDEIITASLTQSRSPTTSIELGLEQRARSFLLRLWGSSAYSFGVIKLDKNTTTTTTKFGLDVYRDLVDFGFARLAMLSNATYDRTTITPKPSTEEEASEAGVPIDKLDYRLIYVGAGIVLSW